MHAARHVDAEVAEREQAAIRVGQAASLRDLHASLSLRVQLREAIGRARAIGRRIIDRTPTPPNSVHATLLGGDPQKRRRDALEDALRSVVRATGWVSGDGELDVDEVWLIGAEQYLTNEEIASLLWQREGGRARPGDPLAGFRRLGPDVRRGWLRRVEQRRRRLSRKRRRLRP